MPVYRARGDRIRAGTYAVGSITSAYTITGFAKQTDMTSGVQWTAPDAFLSQPPRRTRTATLSAYRREGFYFGLWVFSLFTFDMLDLWDTNVMGGAEEAAVSLMTYTPFNEAIYLNATMIRPELPGDARPVRGGWADIRWRYELGTVIT